MRNDALALVAGALSAAGLAVAILTSHPEAAQAEAPVSTSTLPVAAATPERELPPARIELIEFGRKLAATVEFAIEFAARHATPAPEALGDALEVKANAASEQDEQPAGT